MAEEIKKVITVETGGSYKSVKDLKTEISKLRDALVNLTPGTKEYDKAVEKLTAAQNKLNTVMNAGKTSTNSYSGSFKALRDEIKEARDVMAGAARGTEEYAAAASKAAEASDKLRDMQMEIANGASGLDNKFSLISKTLSGISGGFAAAQGAMALFGVESENLQKTFVKLQAAISMTQGFKALAELPKALNAAKIAFNGVSVAAKGTSVALKGVKTAIAATGIGLLIVALGELVANWDKVTEAIGNAVGGLDHLREVMAGVANVIKNFVNGPMKALWQALNGNFKQAAATLKNSFNISANFAEGAAKKATEIANKRMKEQAAINAKDLDYQIRLNEAKKGSDWKYTEEAKKMYDEYFQKMLAQYDENSDEYNEMLIKMEAYNREFTDHQKQEEERRAKELEEARNAAYEKAKELAEKEREVYEDAAAAAGDAVLSEFGKKRAELEKRIKEFEPLITKAFGNPPFKELGESLVKEAEATISKQQKEITTALKEAGLSYEGLMEVLKKGPKEAIPLYAEALKTGGLDLTRELYMVFDKGKAIITNLTQSSWEEVSDIIELYSEKAKESIKNNIIDEGEWQLFIDAVSNIVYQALNDENKEIYELAKTYRMTFDEINDLHWAWYNGYTNVTTSLKDETWKFTEEGKKFYKDYFDGLKKYYANDFDNWMKVLDEEDKYHKEILKHQEDEKRKSLRRQLDEELDIIDERNAALAKQNDDDYFAFAYGEGTWHQVGKFFGFIMEDSIELYDREIALNNQYLENFKEGINAQIAELEAEMALETTTAEEKMNLEREIADLRKELAEESYRVYAENKDKELQKAKKIEAAKKTLASNTAAIFGSLSDYMSTLSDRNAETNEASARKQFEASKALGITETVISTLATVQNIIKSFSGLGPWGIAAGAVAGAAALASGIARVAQIRNQTFDSAGSDGGSSIQTAAAVAVPQLEGENPYGYTRNLTTAEEEDKLNQPVIVQVSDIDDALKVRESRVAETSF